MKALKVTGGLLLGLFLLAVMGYLVLLFINRNDRPPSAAALQFQQIVAARPVVAPADNGAVYVLGFAAPADADPVDVGTRRMAWLESFDEHTDPKADPLPEALQFQDLGAPGLKSLWELCSADSDRSRCAAAFESAARDWQPNDVDALALRRYEALLTRHAWRDVVPFNVAAPFPAYHLVTHAQRLYLLHVMQLVAAGQLDQAREKLSADLAYWRGAVPAADNLIGQMIGVACLRSHFFYTSLILRSLPAADVERVMPADWSREFTAEERSMRRVMAGELAFVGEILRHTTDYHAADGIPADAADRSFMDPWMNRLAMPLFQVQDTVNGIAEMRLRLCQDFEVPLRQYQRQQQRWKEKSASPFSVYNPTGRTLMWLEDGETYANYTLRTASVEGMRRAALLTAQLRARGIPVEAAPDEIAHAELRDPYTEKPFEWDAARHSLIFTAPESHRSRRVEYFY